MHHHIIRINVSKTKRFPHWHSVQVCEDERVPVQVKRTRARKTVKLHKKLSGIKEHASMLRGTSYELQSYLLRRT